ALARHATSKIEATGDLERVATLGFRGEALASVAAVADVLLVSRTAVGSAGMSLRVRNGEEMGEAEASATGVGTRVEVRDLFAAVPARLRFLRAPNTELAAATRVAADIAITRPDVAITCRCNGRVTLRTPGGTLRDALRAVFGTRADRELIDVDAAGVIGVRGAV